MVGFENVWTLLGGVFTIGQVFNLGVKIGYRLACDKLHVYDTYKQSVNPILDFRFSIYRILKSSFIDSTFHPAFNEGFKGIHSLFHFLADSVCFKVERI